MSTAANSVRTSCAAIEDTASATRRRWRRGEHQAEVVDHPGRGVTTERGPRQRRGDVGVPPRIGRPLSLGIPTGQRRDAGRERRQAAPEAGDRQRCRAGRQEDEARGPGRGRRRGSGSRTGRAPCPPSNAPPPPHRRTSSASSTSCQIVGARLQGDATGSRLRLAVAAHVPGDHPVVGAAGGGSRRTRPTTGASRRGAGRRRALPVTTAWRLPSSGVSR